MASASRPVADIEADLARVRAAITAVLTGGQEMQLNSRRVTRASLKDLRDHERALRSELASATAPANTNNGISVADVAGGWA
ncbi:MAG: hypothetical protein AB7Q17_15820 [Phycisphaerae bacterium]